MIEKKTELCAGALTVCAVMYAMQAVCPTEPKKMNDSKHIVYTIRVGSQGFKTATKLAMLFNTAYEGVCAEIDFDYNGCEWGMEMVAKDFVGDEYVVIEKNYGHNVGC